MLKEENIILIGPPWDLSVRLVKHHLARHLARRNKVLYVENPCHSFHLLSHPRYALKKIKLWLTGPRPVSDNLYVHTFFNFFPYHNVAWFTRSMRMNVVNQALIVPQLRALVKKLAMHDPILIVGLPHNIGIIECIGNKLIVYYCSDEYSAISGFPSNYSEVEREFLKKVDLVIATAEPLRQSKARFHKNTYCVTNAADYEHFSRVQSMDLGMAEELRWMQKPIIGYIGSVFEWLDQEMIAHAARMHPNWSFVFIGPITTDVNQLRALPNIHFLGPRPYADLPSYLKGFDVATVPFIFHDVTLRASPIKFYEYLASGVPGVASRLPDFEPFAHLAGLVSTPEEFVTALEDAIAHDTPQKRQARMAEARSHSWEARFAQVDRIIEEALAQKRAGEQTSKDARALRYKGTET